MYASRRLAAAEEVVRAGKELAGGICGYYCFYNEDRKEIDHGDECKLFTAAIARYEEGG